MRTCPSCGKTYAWWRRSCFHGIYNVALTSPPAWWTRMWAWLRGERGGGEDR